MAVYADNDIYLDIGGTAIHSYFKSVTLTPSAATVDVTQGSGTDHVERAVGLKDTSISIQIGYDTTLATTLVQLIKPGAIVAVTYGPEGSASGKPKHLQNFIFSSAPHTVTVGKDQVVWYVSGEGADTPTTDMYAGGVWA